MQIRTLNNYARIFCSVLCLMQLAFVAACLGQSRLVSEQPSPAGRYKAELWEGDTGAVGTWISSVTLVDMKRSFWSHLVGDDKETVFGVDARSTQVKLRWLNDNQLEITCERCGSSPIDLKKSSWRDVTITYRF